MQSFVQIYVHCVWTTKNRRPYLSKQIGKPVFDKLISIAREKNIILDTINGVEDHIHCLVSMKATQSISKIMNDIKGVSSRWINDNQLTEEIFEWQNGYAAFAVSAEKLPIIRNYILNQETHHAHKDYDDELKHLKSPT